MEIGGVRPTPGVQQTGPVKSLKLAVKKLASKTVDLTPRSHSREIFTPTGEKITSVEVLKKNTYAKKSFMRTRGAWIASLGMGILKTGAVVVGGATGVLFAAALYAQQKGGKSSYEAKMKEAQTKKLVDISEGKKIEEQAKKQRKLDRWGLGAIGASLSASVIKVLTVAKEGALPHAATIGLSLGFVGPAAGILLGGYSAVKATKEIKELKKQEQTEEIQEKIKELETKRKTSVTVAATGAVMLIGLAAGFASGGIGAAAILLGIGGFMVYRKYVEHKKKREDASIPPADSRISEEPRNRELPGTT